MRTLFLLLLLVQLPWGLQGQRPSALGAGKFIQSEDHKLLYGGEEPSQHFNIDNLDLRPEQFHYGIGRERFPALIQPEFESVSDAARRWKPSDRFLVAKKDGEVKAYSVKDLTRHEVVNDSIGGEPIFAAYCILADLGAIYKRKYGEKLFTFAVSGYTYYDPKVWNGMDGFILWDRETESLWWPLIDKAVSGPLKEVGLQKLESAYWEDTTWEKVRTAYPEAMVLIPGQQMDPPGGWKSYKDVSDVVSRFRQ